MAGKACPRRVPRGNLPEFPHDPPVRQRPLLLIALAIPLAAREDDFVELKRLEPTLAVELPYATENNFTKERLYPVARCFLRRKVAESLVAAHRSLAGRGLGLKIWDGYRPHSVQYRMWEKAPFPDTWAIRSSDRNTTAVRPSTSPWST